MQPDDPRSTRGSALMRDKSFFRVQLDCNRCRWNLTTTYILKVESYPETHWAMQQPEVLSLNSTTTQSSWKNVLEFTRLLGALGAIEKHTVCIGVYLLRCRRVYNPTTLVRLEALPYGVWFRILFYSFIFTYWDYNYNCCHGDLSTTCNYSIPWVLKEEKTQWAMRQSGSRV
jgi:hypothetical protein